MIDDLTVLYRLAHADPIADVSKNDLDLIHLEVIHLHAGAIKHAHALAIGEELADEMTADKASPTSDERAWHHRSAFLSVEIQRRLTAEVCEDRLDLVKALLQQKSRVPPEALDAHPTEARLIGKW